MKIAFNPSTVAALTSPPNNKDITFDLRGHNIFARGVKFYGTDTNTWRDIKVNNVSIGSNILDLCNGTNTTLTNINGVVTVNSTWRPVVDNLTSDSTTSSLSANQGRVLAGLINSKSDSDHNHDGRYIRKSGDTMLGALNFANGTWNLVGDDSYIGDCNVGGHFGIKAANTTYPGIAFFNKTGNHLGNLTAYSGNIKYGAYSLQFLDNGNTSVSSSTWTNPFSAYNSNAVADGQAICVWGQASQLSNLSTDTGDMSLWLKRVNAKLATLNMVLDGEYYANGNQRLAHVSEIPTSLKNPHSLILKANGTTLAIYDGSSAKEANFTYANVGAASASHTHTWTSITDKIVSGNEFNIVNAGFKEDLWFNYLPINDRSKSATISAYCFGNGNKGYTAVRASGFIINGGNENQLLRADGGVASFNWSGQAGQPTWLWGGNDFNSYYVYNPSNFRVAYASSAGNAETLGGFPKNYGQAPFGTIPCIGNDGVMEIGRYIDYHYDNSGKYDFSTRLQTTGNYANEVNLPSASGTLALISQVLTWKSQIIDMRNYSESYWHPVTVPLPYTGYNKIKVSVQLNSGDKPSWATHRDGITCNMEIWATASGWGTTDSDTICLNYTYKFCSQNPCGWMQLGSPSLGVVFLRGGSRYTVYTDFDATFTPHNQKYTWSNDGSSQDTGGPYTSCPGLNFNMGAIRADLIATMVQARRVCAGHDPGIDNSISCSNWFRSSGNTGWYNTTYQGGWYMSDTSWIRAHNNVGIYTGGQIYSSSSIKMGNILLEHTDEINNITNGGINLNYRNSGNISLCQGGGRVGIGTMSPTYKLDVDGHTLASGFIHRNHQSDDAVLLAGGSYKTLNSIYGGDINHPVFLGYLNLDHGNDGTVSSSFSCLGYSVPFTYTRGGNYCRITIPDTTYQVFYIKAATASVNYSGGGMDTWVGYHRGSGAWWLHCYASGANEIRVKGFRQSNDSNDSWWGGNPLWSNNDGANKITVCIFGYVEFR